MIEDDPYAPPKTAEPEAASLRYWKCYGERVMAKNSATLPMVDLETGVSDVAMTVVPRSYQPFGIYQGLRGFIPVGVYLAVRNYRTLADSDSLWFLVGGAILLSWILRMSGAGGGAIMIWEHREASSERRRMIRRKLRTGLLVIACALVIFGPSRLATSYSSSIQVIVAGGVILMISIIWRVFDKPKTRCESALYGWLRIRNIHPEAMRKLRVIEKAEMENSIGEELPLVRKIYTVFLYRFPLRFLIGRTTKNPLTILAITLMKLLRSKRLEREAFEYSEAKEIREDEIHSRLSELLSAWQVAHPDWAVIQRHRLPSPSGDITVDSVFLTSPRLEHILCLHHTWTVRDVGAGIVEFSFLTWLEGGKILCTSEVRPLPIPRLSVEYVRIKGGIHEVFQAHERRCANHRISPAENRGHLLARLAAEKQETSNALETVGLRGPSYEAR